MSFYIKQCMHLCSSVCGSIILFECDGVLPRNVGVWVHNYLNCLLECVCVIVVVQCVCITVAYMIGYVRVYIYVCDEKRGVVCTKSFWEKKSMRKKGGVGGGLGVELRLG